MDRAQEQGGRSFWTAEVLERDEAGTPKRVRVLDRIEDVEGHGWSNRGLGETEQDVEGQGFRWSGFGETEQDVEGQGFSYRGLRPTDDDVEGQGHKYGLGETEQDVEGHPYRWILPEGEADSEGHVLMVAEGIPAAERIQGRTFVVEDDVEGQGYRFGG